MASDQSDSTLAASEKSHQLPHDSRNTPKDELAASNRSIEHITTDRNLSPQHSHTAKPTSSQPASLSPTRSYGDGHGYTAFGNDEEEAHPKDVQSPEESEKQYEVRWDGDSDSMNPRCMSKAHKWTVVAIVSLGSTCVTCTSSMYTSTYGQITEEWGVSRVVATLGLSLFVIGLGLGPVSKLVFGLCQVF